jgi:hypothetical protein
LLTDLLTGHQRRAVRVVVVIWWCFRGGVALWDYHDMHHELRPTDVAVGLGSHDLGVATYTADLYQRGM